RGRRAGEGGAVAWKRWKRGCERRCASHRLCSSGNLLRRQQLDPRSAERDHFAVVVLALDAGLGVVRSLVGAAPPRVQDGAVVSFHADGLAILAGKPSVKEVLALRERH